jgi:conjugative relaxase-like TrwC/TraI family protein
VYANQIAFGKLYREVLKPLVEKLGYETEVTGKHGMWEMKMCRLSRFPPAVRRSGAAGLMPP